MKEITVEKSLSETSEKAILCDKCFGASFGDCHKCEEDSKKVARKMQFRTIMSEIFDTESIDQMQEDLERLKFFDAPASVKHHGSRTGGLFEHSYCVTQVLLDLTKRLDLKWAHRRSPYMIGMFHDLCKCENYVFVQEPEGHWEYNREQKLPGHGEKSAMMAMRLTHLSEEEMMCIRWHMGAFDDSKNWEYFSRAVHDNPNVLYVHMADMIASQIHEI